MGSSGTSPSVSFAVDLLLPCLCFSHQRAPAVSAIGRELAVGRAAHAGQPRSRVRFKNLFLFVFLFPDLMQRLKNPYLEF
jgi:hypothetical protein